MKYNSINFHFIHLQKQHYFLQKSMHKHQYISVPTDRWSFRTGPKKSLKERSGPQNYQKDL